MALPKTFQTFQRLRTRWGGKPGAGPEHAQEDAEQGRAPPRFPRRGHPPPTPECRAPASHDVGDVAGNWPGGIKEFASPAPAFGKEATEAGAVDAHRAAGKVYDYYRTVHGRNSLDSRGMTVNSLVGVRDYGAPYVNAFWDCTKTVYGGGDSEAYSVWAGRTDSMHVDGKTVVFEVTLRHVGQRVVYLRMGETDPTYITPGGDGWGRGPSTQQPSLADGRIAFADWYHENRKWRTDLEVLGTATGKRTVLQQLTPQETVYRPLPPASPSYG
ncbi:hypothetical protein [Streptomyces sp. NPDC001404]|uniref:hypothetical protein n=1 Tax=Streptomyces sp. NPDC001404 TaxID=3364571 RepID=UPI0036B7722C